MEAIPRLPSRWRPGRETRVPVKDNPAEQAAVFPQRPLAPSAEAGVEGKPRRALQFLPPPQGAAGCSGLKFSLATSNSLPDPPGVSGLAGLWGGRKTNTLWGSPTLGSAPPGFQPAAQSVGQVSGLVFATWKLHYREPAPGAPGDWLGERKEVWVTEAWDGEHGGGWRAE